MFNKLYDNCFKTEMTTNVVAVQEEKGMYWHAFQDTIFYMESGGMPSDIGMIDNHLVKGLKKEGGHLWHLLDVALEGSVYMSVNLHERFRKCQAHTAQHLISAIMGNVYGVKTVSHHLGDEYCDVEFNFEAFSDKMANELQVLCNGLIRDDLPVTILYPTRTEALSHLSQQKAMKEDLRIVRIGVLDYTPCGCMHVPSLRYLQMLFIEGFEKTSRGYRIRYLVGDQLLDCVIRRYRVLDEASATLAVPHLYLNTGVSRLVNEVHQLHKQSDTWKKHYIRMLAEDMKRQPKKVLTQIFEELDAGSIQRLAQYVCEADEKAVIFISKQYDNAHVVIAKGKNSDFVVADVFQTFVEKFHIKGMQKTHIAQGGGLYAEAMKEQLQAFAEQAN